MRILAIDLGLTRTGLAVCDKGELMASPLKVITQRDFALLLQEIAEIAKAENIEQIVLGHPLNMDGSAGESAQRSEQFAEKLSGLTQLPVVLRDERGTTVSAHRALNTTNVRGKKRKAVVDAVAATIILQNYLDYRKNRKKE